MCMNNHPPAVMQYIAQADLGVRLLMRGKELSLSGEQIGKVLDHCGRWRQRYIELVESAAELGREIDLELMNHVPEATRITPLLEQRRSIMARVEDEFIEAWISLNTILDRAPAVSGTLRTNPRSRALERKSRACRSRRPPV